MLGRPVTNALINAGFEVSVLARNSGKAKQLFPAASIQWGDVLDPISMLAAFEGTDAIYISLQAPRGARQHQPLPEREGMANILSAAKVTGIGRIAYLSSLVKQYNHTNGFHWWVLDMKQAAVDQIKSSGIPYTLFYPSTFMESFDGILRQGNKIMLAGNSRVPMHFIAAADYAQQVVHSFNILTTENKEYPVQGPEAWNWDDGAHIFIDHYPHAALKILKTPLGLLKFAGHFNRTIQYGAKIVEAMNNYPEKFESEKTWQELGKPVITIADYAAGLAP